MAEEFKPQFPHALLRGGYQRWKNPYNKLYVGCFYRHNQPVKFTNRLFKRASEAEDHSRKVLARYAKIVNAKMLAMMTEVSA